GGVGEGDGRGRGRRRRRAEGGSGVARRRDRRAGQARSGGLQGQGERVRRVSSTAGGSADPAGATEGGAGRAGETGGGDAALSGAVTVASLGTYAGRRLSRSSSS